MSLGISTNFLPSISNLIVQWIQPSLKLSKVLITGVETREIEALFSSSFWNNGVVEVVQIVAAPPLIGEPLRSMLPNVSRGWFLRWVFWWRPTLIDGLLIREGRFDPHPSKVFKGILPGDIKSVSFEWLIMYFIVIPNSFYDLFHSKMKALDQK